MSKASLAVVGVGAIGGAVAADLVDLGHDVVLCSRSPFDRLVVNHPTGISRIETPARTSASEIESTVDWVLLATKAHQSRPAKTWLDRLCGPTTRVAVLQNGVDHVERIQPLVPNAAAVLPVVVQLPSERTGAETIEQSLAGTLFVPDTPEGHAFVALFEGGRTRVEVRSDFVSQAWWKLLSNAAIGGICALAVRPNRAMDDAHAQDLGLALMREIVEVARAEGAELPDDAPEKVMRVMLAAAPDHWSSISVDRREGRPMEWEVRNAIVGRLGRRHGIATPLNDAITTLLELADPG